MKDTAPDCTANTQYESLANKAACAKGTVNDFVQLPVGEYKRLVAGQFDYKQLHMMKEAALAMARDMPTEDLFAQWLALAAEIVRVQRL